MSTSYIGAPIRFDDAEYAANAAFSAHQAQTLVNNALSFADQNGQVRACWETHDSASLYMTPRTPMTVSRFYKIVEVGPFPLLVRENGAPYNLRCRVAGYTNQANTVQFRLIVAPWGAPTGDLTSGTITRPELVLVATTNSTTHGWLTPVGDNLLEPEAIDAVDALSEITTLDGIGGDPVGVDECLFTMSVWASTTNASAIPRLTGYYVAENHPPP